MTTDYLMCGRPRHCGSCKHAYYGLLHMVSEAQNRGFNIMDLAGSDCVKDTIYQAIADYDPLFFFGIGHGNNCVYTDDNTAHVWECTSLPPSNLAGRISYLWSCLTANGLGPKIIELGGWAYAGFNISWTWMYDPPMIDDPYDDKYSRGFYEAGNELILALLQMKTISEAGDQSIAKYNEWIDYWKNEGSGDPYALSAINWLVHDRDGLVLLGDTSATLGPPIDCSQFDNEDDCLAHNCYWYNGACHSSPPPCSSYTNKTDCEAHACYWWNSSCHDNPPSCSEINNQTDCLAYGCYWYNGACHSEPPPCDYYTTQDSCEAAGCYWYNGACHSEPPVCENINNEADCIGHGCYWYDGGCHSVPPVQPVDDTQDFTIKIHPMPTKCEEWLEEQGCTAAGCEWWGPDHPRDPNSCHELGMKVALLDIDPDAPADIHSDEPPGSQYVNFNFGKRIKIYRAVGTGMIKRGDTAGATSLTFIMAGEMWQNRVWMSFGWPKDFDEDFNETDEWRRYGNVLKCGNPFEGVTVEILRMLVYYVDA